jgi:hypothetical protein
MDKDITYNDPSRFGPVNVVPDLPSLEEITPNKGGINISYGLNTESQAINVNQGASGNLEINNQGINMGYGFTHGDVNNNSNQGINMGYGLSQGEGNNNQDQGINMGYGYSGNNQK